ncbi:MAG: hypothetical protein QOG26_974 [Solirubrobacterales bacterium]|nr:hypothetical protein [Solirubrobacterales bacterium]
MTHRRPIGALVLVMAILVLAGCKQAGEPEGAGDPARVEPIHNSDVSRITLEPEAARRIDVRTAPVEQTGGRKRIPYSAVLYTADGDTFVYVSPRPLSYQREAIEVDRIDGDSAILTKGPAAGVEVVVRAAQEVYGTEFGVDE